MAAPTAYSSPIPTVRTKAGSRSSKERRRSPTARDRDSFGSRAPHPAGWSIGTTKTSICRSTHTLSLVLRPRAQSRLQLRPILSPTPARQTPTELGPRIALKPSASTPRQLSPPRVQPSLWPSAGLYSPRFSSRNRPRRRQRSRSTWRLFLQFVRSVRLALQHGQQRLP